MAGGQAAAALLRSARITDAQIVRDGVKSEVDDDAGLSFGELTTPTTDHAHTRSSAQRDAPRESVARSRTNAALRSALHSPLIDDILHAVCARDMSREFDGLYATVGRPSIPPERLLRAQLLQIFYSIRSE